MNEEPQMQMDDDGTKTWMLHGKLHRCDAPTIEYFEGSTVWYQHGLRHRTDGPAVDIKNSHKEWWVHGKLHRIDGPAIDFIDLGKIWYVNGERLNSIDAWVAKALQYEGKECTKENIDQKIAQVMQQDLF